MALPPPCSLGSVYVLARLGRTVWLVAYGTKLAIAGVKASRGLDGKSIKDHIYVAPTRTCRLIWPANQRHERIDQLAGNNMAAGGINRGVYYGDGSA